MGHYCTPIHKLCRECQEIVDRKYGDPEISGFVSDYLAGEIGLEALGELHRLGAKRGLSAVVVDELIDLLLDAGPASFGT